MPADASNVPGPDRAVAQLTAIYAQAERDLEALIRDAVENGADWTADYRRQQLAQVQRILKGTQQVIPAAQAAVRLSYATGITAVDKALRSAAPAYGVVHTSAVDVLAQALTDTLDESVREVGRRAPDVFRRAQLLAVAQQTAQGGTRRQVSKSIIDQLAHDGVTSFVDRSGRRWRMSTYAQMAARTVTREAVTVASWNRMDDHGIDLITVSDHNTQTELCEQYEGKTYTRTGATPGYERLERLPPFHPNCWHVISPATGNLDAYEAALRDDPDVGPVAVADDWANVPRGDGAVALPDDLFPDGKGAVRGEYLISGQKGRDRDYLTQLVRESKTSRGRDDEIIERLAEAARAGGLADDVDAVFSIPADPGKVDRFIGIRQGLADRLGAGASGSPLRERFDIPGYRQMTAAQRRAATASLGGRFEVTDAAAVRGKTILLVDDVITSGAQAQEVRAALLAAGAKDVRFVALARAKSVGAVAKDRTRVMEALAARAEQLRTRPLPTRSADLEEYEREVTRFGGDLRRTVLDDEDYVALRRERDRLASEYTDLHERTKVAKATWSRRSGLYEGPDYEAYTEVQRRLVTARTRRDRLDQVIAERRQRLLADALGRVRPGFGKGTVQITGRKTPVAKSVIAQGRFLPREWIERAGRLRVKSARGRAFYQDGYLEVKASDLSTALHELGHHMEAGNRRVTLLEEAFHFRRRAGEQSRRLRDITGIRAYEEWERAVEDRFTSPYIGKIYSGQNFWEVLTMGLEGVWYGRHGIPGDDDLMDFIVGLLAGA